MPTHLDNLARLRREYEAGRYTPGPERWFIVLLAGVRAGYWRADCPPRSDRRARPVRLEPLPTYRTTPVEPPIDLIMRIWNPHHR